MHVTLLRPSIEVRVYTYKDVQPDQEVKASIRTFSSQQQQQEPNTNESLRSQNNNTIKMYTSTLTALAMALTSSLTFASPAPYNRFEVNHYRHFCTITEPQVCASTFNVTYQDSSSYACTVKDTDTGYQYCQTPGPEVSMAAYLEDKKFLNLRYELAFPSSDGVVKQDTYGRKRLTGKEDSAFEVKVVKQGA